MGANQVRQYYPFPNYNPYYAPPQPYHPYHPQPVNCSNGCQVSYF
jgi:hypothetical protein